MSNSLHLSLSEAMRSLADPSLAQAMSDYMKNQFAFLGLKAPARKEVLRACRPETDALSMQQLWDLVEYLWQQPEREFQQAATDLLIRKKKHLRRSDLSKIKKYITTKSWWDTVDFLASHMAGSYFLLYPAEAEAETTRWVKGENMWLQRSALLFQLKYKTQTDTELLYAHICALAEEKDFFIRKAIGWVLREYAKTDQASARSVSNFLASNQVSALSRKEALKYLGQPEL